ncbi:MAG: hypothetical protein HGA35_04775, partial [Erysipelotrichaceae bacterium]|nr:hypothetical protein [Erysipelotrichaceae bacterium]
PRLLPAHSIQSQESDDDLLELERDQNQGLDAFQLELHLVGTRLLGQVGHTRDVYRFGAFEGSADERKTLHPQALESVAVRLDALSAPLMSVVERFSAVTIEKEVTSVRAGELADPFQGMVDGFLDPDFNPDEVPARLVRPPPTSEGVIFPPGVDPARIQEPGARAQYEKDIAANNAEIAKYNMQIEIIVITIGTTY